jgi:tetratricopeptide (TPR) repeat protein
MNDSMRRALVRYALVGIVLLAAASAHPQSEDADALSQQAEQLIQSGKYADATEVALRALALQEKASGSDHLAVAKILNALATLYRIQRRYLDAERALSQSLAIEKTALGLDHPQLCQSLTHFSVLYGSQGRHADAEPYLNRCLSIRETARGPDHVDVGQSLHELARLYRTQGRRGEAEPIFARAVRLMGLNHPEAVLAAIRAGEFATAARALNLGSRAGTGPDAAARAVRQTFLGQVTDLRWTSYRSSLGRTPSAITIEGEATHGNNLWQPFAVQLVLEGIEWKLRAIDLRGHAWR